MYTNAASISEIFLLYVKLTPKFFYVYYF